MDSLNFNELWKDKQAAMPAHQEIFAKADKLKKNIRNKSLLMILALLATAVFIFIVWFNVDLEMATSRIGVTLIIIALAFGIVNSMKSAWQSNQGDMTADADKYLKHLLDTKRLQEISQTKVLSTYFVLLTAGLGLYMYEPASHMKMWGQVITWTVTMGWLAFNWFYLRPRAIKKQNAKLNAIIERLQSISSSLAKAE